MRALLLLVGKSEMDLEVQGGGGSSLQLIAVGLEAALFTVFCSSFH